MLRIVLALPPERLEDGRYENGWNGRQILAHLASIEWTYPRLIDITCAASTTQAAPSTARSADELATRTMRGGNDAHNERQVAKRAHLSAAELLAEFERNRAATILAVEAADEPLFACRIRSAGGVTVPLATVFHQIAVAHADERGPISASSPTTLVTPMTGLPGILKTASLMSVATSVPGPITP